MRHTARKSVELPHQDTRKGVLARGTHERLELRPAFLTSRAGLIHILGYNGQPGPCRILVEAIGLEIRSLVGGRDAEIERRTHRPSFCPCARDDGHRLTRYTFSDGCSILS